MEWGIGIALLGILILAVWRGTKGPVYHIDGLIKPISALLKRGYDCGFLIISIGYSGRRFLQLRKYIHGPGNYGIQLAFPNANWAQPYFESVHAICKTRHLKGVVANDGTLDFLYVDFTRDAIEAYKCVKAILEQTFDVGKDTKLFVRLENAAVEDKLIDAPSSRV